MANETIQQDVETTSQNTPDLLDALDPVEAFKRHLKGDGKSTQETERQEPNPEDETREADEDDAEDREGSEQDDQDDTDPEGSEKPPEEKTERRAAGDDDEVTIKVGDEEHKVSVKDLKRLFGQEQALTRKGQETAALQETIRQEQQRYAAGLDKMAKAAEARWKEYETIDYAAARDSMSPEAYAKLRQDAAQAYQDHKFYGEELTQLVETQQREHVTKMRDAARTCLTTLTRAPTEEAPNPAYIEGWNDTVYDEVRSFALSIGGDRQVIDSIVDPVTIKIIHMAMKQHRAEQRAKTIKAAPKVPATSTRVPATTERRSMPNEGTTTAKRALERARETGSFDDASAAFRARLRSQR